MNTKNKALIGMVVCIVIWGSAFTVSGFLLQHNLSPYLVVFARFVLALPITLVLKRKKARVEKLLKSDIVMVIAAAIFGSVLYFIFEYNGIKYISPGVASIILALTPALVLLAECIINKKMPRLFSAIGVMLNWTQGTKQF